MLIYVSETAWNLPVVVWTKREIQKHKILNCFSVEKEGKKTKNYRWMSKKNSSPRQFSNHSKTD